MRVTIIGGGILGTAHALEAIQRGHHVTHLEREVEARGATVRNFGLVWVSGRADVELDAALRSRELWEQHRRAHSRRRIPARGLADAVAHARARSRSPKQVVARVPTPRRADSNCSNPTGSARSIPRCAASSLPALHCSRDGAVESRQAMPAIRALPGGHRPVHVRARHRGALDRRPGGARRPRPPLRRRPGAAVPRRRPRRPDPGDRRRAARPPGAPADDADRTARRAAHHRDRRRRQLPLLPGLRG